MADPERLSDGALVVRCGQPPFGRPTTLSERCDIHEGVFGFSAQSADGVPLDRLAAWCPNRKVGVLTVGEIRALGYDVVITSGQGYHASVVVPRAWDPAAAEGLAHAFREATNPSPRKSR